MVVGMDLISRLESHANSWTRDGLVAHDAFQGRDPEAEASILREAAEALRMLADWAGEDSVGHAMVSTVGNYVFEGAEQIIFHDNFIAFNDPKKWLSSHRAAAAYIAEAWLAERRNRPPEAKVKDQ